MIEGDLRGPQVLVGIKQSTEAVKSGTAEMAYVAQDADEAVRLPFVELCMQHLIPITFVDSKKELGKACGIKVAAACAVTLLRR